MRLAKSLLYVLPSLVLGVSTFTVGMAVDTGFAPAVHAADKAASISPKLAKILKPAQDLMNQQKYQEAKKKLAETDAISPKTPFEQYTINQFQSFLSVKLGDYASAAKAYEAMVESGLTPKADMAQTLKGLVQLNYQIKNYGKVTKYAQRYLNEVGPDVDMNLIMAQTSYLQKDYRNAIQATEGAIKTAEAQGKSVKEDWLNLLMSAQYNLGNTAGVSKTLETLVAKYPAAKYWKDLLGSLQGQSGLTDRENLEIYRLKSATGVLEGGPESVEMAELSMQLGLPGDAVTVLKKGFSSGTLGAGPNKERENRLMKAATTQAALDQKSLAQFAKEADKAKTGDPYVKLAEAYVSYNQVDMGIEAYKKGLAKGSLKDEDLTQLHLGLAYLAKNQNDQAVAAFQKVSRNSKYSRLARLWVIKTQR